MSFANSQTTVSRPSGRSLIYNRNRLRSRTKTCVSLDSTNEAPIHLLNNFANLGETTKWQGCPRALNCVSGLLPKLVQLHVICIS